MAVTALLDVSVLIALAWPNHVHHAAARAWFQNRRDDGWATCTLTEAGFARVSCNPSVVGHTVGPLDAIDTLANLRSLGRHTFLAAGPVGCRPARCHWIQAAGVSTDQRRRVVGRRHSARRTACDAGRGPPAAGCPPASVRPSPRFRCDEPQNPRKQRRAWGGRHDEANVTDLTGLWFQGGGEVAGRVALSCGSLVSSAR